jgi:general secretion pathway protein G
VRWQNEMNRQDARRKGAKREGIEVNRGQQAMNKTMAKQNERCSDTAISSWRLGALAVHFSSTAKRKAFTLIEFIVVMTIIGILAALIVPRFIGRVAGAKKAVAQQKITVLEGKVNEFQADCGRFPTQQEGLQALLQKPGDCAKWNGPYVKEKDVMDPWDVEFIYRYPGQRNTGDYDLMTLGADKQEGGEDENADIGNW